MQRGDVISGSRSQILMEATFDEDELVEVQVLKEALNSVPSPSTHTKSSNKKKRLGINVEAKVIAAPVHKQPV